MICRSFGLWLCAGWFGMAGAGLAQSGIDSACRAMAAGEARVIPAAFGAPLAAETVRVRFLGHASFALETPGGILAVTDYTGFIGNPDVVPDVVTMNNAHDTHFTDTPDPRIPLVLRGPFGEGARQDGNSIFLFEAAGLCIGHLGHLHQILSDAQYGAIGRLDVVMVPVDGNFTMDAKTMAAVVSRFRARLILPMHWFSAEGLREFLVEMGPGFEVVLSDSPEVEVSLDTLPRRPTLMVLDPALIP